jgi:hypothetical protein
MKPRLGEMLVNAGIVTREQLDYALNRQKETGKPLGGLLIELGFITREELGVFLQKFWNARSVDLASQKIRPDVLLAVPYQVCRRYSVVPVEISEEKITIACIDPTKIDFNKLKEILGKDIEPVVVPANQIEYILENYTHMVYSTADLNFFLKGLNDSDVLYIIPDSPPAICTGGRHIAYMNLPPVSPSIMKRFLEILKGSTGNHKYAFLYEIPAGRFRIIASESGIVAKKLSLRKDVKLTGDIKEGLYFICGRENSGRTSLTVSVAEYLCKQSRKVLMICDVIEYPLRKGLIIQVECSVEEIPERLKYIPYFHMDAVLLDHNQLYIYERFEEILEKLLKFAVSKSVFLTLPLLSERQISCLEEKTHTAGVKPTFVFCRG